MNSGWLRVLGQRLYAKTSSDNVDIDGESGKSLTTKLRDIDKALDKKADKTLDTTSANGLMSAADKATLAATATAHEERLNLLEYMNRFNDYFCPVLDDDLCPILDDDGMALIGDWKYSYL